MTVEELRTRLDEILDRELPSVDGYDYRELHESDVTHLALELTHACLEAWLESEERAARRARPIAHER